MAGKSRKKELVYPRQITMYLLRKELNTSYPTIGQELEIEIRGKYYPAIVVKRPFYKRS